ncbi:MAG TPA: hydrolase 1, exosortase A system-associated, partial [Burkholderiales bacterium]|nr:hydrolase 1, exosortase A system-associated [Burkholderiales bacterium]
MKYSEHATTVTCEGRTLVGVLTAPADGGARGVLIVVGGPQYRAGSHRQFVLLARRLAHDGIPAMRFDCRGMGDSEGEPRHFDAIDEDIAAALDAFMQAHSGLREVVLWALCDAVPACARVAHHDARVRGLVLLNPWVQSAAGEAKTYLRHYYLKRLLERALWRKVLHGELNVGRSARSLAQHCRD